MDSKAGNLGFAGNFKSSRANLVSAADKRSLRAHRKSIEWRQMRDMSVNVRRNIRSQGEEDMSEDEISPPVEDSNIARPLISRQVKQKEEAKFSRKEKLAEWRREKELEKMKQKEDLKASKKLFLVKKTQIPSLAISSSRTTKTKTNPEPILHRSKAETTKASTVSTRRVTRASSASKSCEEKPAKASNPGRKPHPKAGTAKEDKTTKRSQASKLVLPTVKPNAFDFKSSAGASKLPTKSKPPAAVPKATKAEAPRAVPTRMTRSRSVRNEPPKISPVRRTKSTTTRGSNRSTKATQPEKNAPKPGPSVRKDVGRSKSTTTPAKKKEEFPALTPANTKKITISRGERDTSFAPSDFKFTVPSSVSDFTFKPLSPNSATNFMFPGSQKEVSPISSGQMASTPITSDPCLNLIHSPVSSIRVSKPADSEDETKTLSTNAPVMVLVKGETAVSSPAGKHKRRSSRRSLSQEDQPDIQSEAMDTTEEPAKPVVATPGRRHSRRLSASIEPDSDSGSQSSQVESDTEVTKKSRRRSGRRASGQDTDNSGCDEANTGKDMSDMPATKTPRRRSRRLSGEMQMESNSESEMASDRDTPMESESTQSDSQNSESEQAADDTAVSQDWSKRQRSRRKSRFTSSLASIELESVKEVSEPNSPALGDTSTEKHSSTGVSGTSLADALSEVKRSRVVMDDAVFVTPSATVRESARRLRTKSVGPVLSGGQSAGSSRVRSVPRNNRTSLILRTLSPEEGIEVLKHSPMVELSRGKTPRSNKSNRSGVLSLNSPGLPILDFGDADDILTHEGEKELANQSQTELLVQCLQKIKSPEAKTYHSGVERNADPPADGGVPTEATTVATEHHDLAYFRQMIIVNTEKLSQLCEEWEEIKTQDADMLQDKPDVSGQLDTVIGQAQLLMGRKGRFKQFGDLVDDCELGRGEKETTCQDLQGFWDMVYYQIEDVIQKFKNMSSLRLKKYVVDKPKPVKKTVKKAASKPKAPSAKSKFAEFRNKMKQQGAAESGKSPNVLAKLKEMVQSPAKPVVMLEPETEVKTMEFGFFKVCSPVCSPAPHCDGSTPSKSTALRKTITPAGSPLLHNVLHKAVRRSAHGPSPLLQEGERGSRGPSPLLQDITRASPMTIGTPKTGTQRRSSVTTLFSQTMENNVESNPEEKTTDKMSSTPAEQRSTRRSVVSLEVPGGQNVCTSTESEPMECDNLIDAPHDIPYFRKMIITQTEILTKFCEEWELIKSEDSVILSSKTEMAGQLDTVIGQAQLLMGRKGRFKQFGDLVDDCEFGRGERETTCQDLQGFWDMVYYQIEDVIVKFGDLSKLRANQWICDKPKTQPVKKIVKKTSKAVKPKAPAVKSKFAAYRSQMKKQQSGNVEQTGAASSTDVKPGTPVSMTSCTNAMLQAPVILVLPDEEVKTFEAGFFSVSSPVRSPAFHCEGGTPRRSTSRPTTPAASPLLRTVVERAARRSVHGPSPLLQDTTSSLGPSPLLQDTTSSLGTSPLVQDTTSSMGTSTLAQDSSVTPRGTKRKSVFLMSFDSPNPDSSPSKKRRSAVSKENLTTVDAPSLFSPDTSAKPTPPARGSRRSSRKSTRIVSFATEPTEIDTNVPQSSAGLEDSFARYLAPSQVTDLSVQSDTPPFAAWEKEEKVSLLITPPSGAPSGGMEGPQTPTEAFSKLRVEYTPGVGKPTRTKRVSELLYSPPSRMATPEESNQTITLMSFSPADTSNAAPEATLGPYDNGTPSTRGSRRSTRLSLL